MAVSASHPTDPSAPGSHQNLEGHAGHEGHDVIVVGGGAAGLAAAVTLARARRDVLVVDAGEPRNAPADGVHAFLTRDGLPPAELVALGQAEARGYGAEIVSGRAVGARRVSGGGFEVDLADGSTRRARRLVVTSGLRDELPEVEGLRERWGRDVIHCPYCHGYEVRDEPIGVLGTGAAAMHQVMLFAQLSDDVTYFRHTAPELSDDEREQLAARGIVVVETPVDGLVVEGDRLVGVRLSDGTTLARSVLVVAPRMVASSPVLDALGATTVPHPLGAEFGEFYPADPMTLASSVPGVWLAGNVQDLQAQVVTAASQGTIAAARLNADLVADDTARAVARHRASRSTAGHHHAGHDHGAHDLPTDAPAFWEAHYGRSEQIWSGRVNPVLAQVAATLPAGRALDVGCGEGGDAVWLAEQGWHVEAIDISPTALARARRAVDAAGVGERVHTARFDLEHELPTGSYELISAQFFMSPIEFPRDRVLRDLADRLAPGGVLLVVDHGSAPPQSGHDDAEFRTVQETLDALALDSDRFVIERCDAPTRTIELPDGTAADLLDNVIVARRR